MADGRGEHRRYPRIKTVNPVHVKRLTAEVLEATGKTAQLGLGGCMFVNRESLGAGSTVDLVIGVPGGAINAQGRVVYERTRGSREFEVGIEFLAISPRDRSALEKLFDGVEAVITP
jgi:hypothetical protein